jgi:hypothetical protein
MNGDTFRDPEPCNCCGYYHCDAEDMTPDDRDRAIMAHLEAGDIDD